METHPPRAPRLLATVALLGLAGWALAWGIRGAFGDGADLARRSQEVRLWLERSDPYADPDCTYPPGALPVFAALLGPWPESAHPTIGLVINLASLVALAAGLHRIAGRAGGLHSLALLLLALTACRPSRAGLALGQFHLTPLALAAWTVPLLAARRSLAAGVLLGLALVKPTMVLPLALLWAARGEGRALAAAMGTQLGLTLVSAAWLARSPFLLTREWMTNAGTQVESGTLDAASILTRMVPGLAGQGPWLSLAMGAVAAVLILAIRRASLSASTAASLGLAAVATYHRHYDLALLSFPILDLIQRYRRPEGQGGTGRITAALAAALALLLVLPTNPSWARGAGPMIDLAVLTTTYAVVALQWRAARQEAKKNAQPNVKVRRASVPLAEAATSTG